MKSLRQANVEQLKYLTLVRQGKIKSVKTPWDVVNRAYYNGLGWGWIGAIGGMSGSGKTAAAIHLMTEIDALNTDQEIYQEFYSYEMPAIALAGRVLSKKYGYTQASFYPGLRGVSIDNSTFKKLYEKERVIIQQQKEDADYKDKIFIEEKTMTVKQLEASIRKRLKMMGVKAYDVLAPGLIVYIDHTNLMKQEKYDDSTKTIAKLFAMQNELKKLFPKIIFINLSQLNRNIQDGSRRNTLKHQLHNHYPVTSDIFGSSEIEHYADFMWVLHNPSKLNIVKYGPMKYDTHNRVFLHDVKSRHSIGFRDDPIIMDATKLAFSELIEAA